MQCVSAPEDEAQHRRNITDLHCSCKLQVTHSLQFFCNYSTFQILGRRSACDWEVSALRDIFPASPHCWDGPQDFGVGFAQPPPECTAHANAASTIRLAVPAALWLGWCQLPAGCPVNALRETAALDKTWFLTKRRLGAPELRCRVARCFPPSRNKSQFGLTGGAVWRCPRNILLKAAAPAR